MRSTLLTFALSALAAAPALAAPGGDNWYADYDKALAAAVEQDKHLLVDFTGSDWCGWCKKLDAEVFSHDAFLEGVADDYVLVALDFPRAPEIKAQVPDPERNAELRDKWGVRGYPTILLVNTDSQAYAQTGYRAGGPEAYVTHLEEIATSGKQTLAKMSEMVEKFEAAEGAARRASLAELVGLLESQPARSPFVADLVGYAKRAVALEGEDAAGLRLRAVTALLDAGVYDDEVAAAIDAIDPENAEGLRERALVARMSMLQSVDQVGGWVDDVVALADGPGIRDAEIARDLYINVAFMADKYLDQPERAKSFAKRALELGNVEDEATLEMLRGLSGADQQTS